MNLSCESVARAALGEPLKRKGTELFWCAPWRDDRDPSLHVNTKKDVWSDFPAGIAGNAWELAAQLAGCDPGDKPSVAAWLREHGLLSSNGVAKTIVALYDYTDANGQLLYQKVRYEPKDFRLRRPDGKGGWIWNAEGITPTLYNLPEVLKSNFVLLVEGEKDVETARKMGLVATTSGGVGSWHARLAEYLRDKGVAVIADADEPGKKHARQEAADLVGVAKWVRLPDLSLYGKDLTEFYVPDSPLRGKDSLLKRIKGCPVLTAADVATWKVSGQAKASRSDGFQLLSIGDLFRAPEEKISWIVQERLPAGGFSILAGKPKAGKSTLARCLALAVSRGKPFLGWETTAGPVLYLALEEKLSEVRSHFRAMGATGDEPIFIHAAHAPQDAVLALMDIVREHKPVLVIVDPLLKLTRLKSADDYAEVSAALEPLLMLARESGAHLLAVYHSPKMERADLIDSPLGSTAFAAAVDTLLVLKRTDRYRTIATVQRYGSDLPETVIEFNEQSRTVLLGVEKGQAEQERIGAAIVEYLAGCKESQTEEQIIEEVEGKQRHKRAALREFVKRGEVCRSGSGKRGEPYLYHLSRVQETAGVRAGTKKPESGGDEESSYSRTHYPTGTRVRATRILGDLAENTAKKLVPDSVQAGDSWVHESGEPGNGLFEEGLL
ncbi:MAG TPA: AAA family ATPase [Terriglobia bacterium]|nr:AAA family ATPase [Terriglobia bacterium]